MILVKICGIREEEHAKIAAEAGASLIGFVFVPVRREVKPADARAILSAVREQFEHPPAAVGLFVNETANTVNRTVAEVGLDLVQLHGDEPPEFADDIDVPVIKALRIEAGHTETSVRERVEAFLKHSPAVHLDTHVPGKWGGTGVIGDWDLASRIASEYPVVLAGGLAPENVSEAIQTVRPAIVDVSTGVETDGRKDPGKIRTFIQSARGDSTGVAFPPVASSLHDLIHSIRRSRASAAVQPHSGRN